LIRSVVPPDGDHEINLHAPRPAAADYCGDVHLRLSFTKLATAKTPTRSTLLEEIVDRFGNLPPQAKRFRLMCISSRVIAKSYGAVKVMQRPAPSTL
jgi:transcription-repair coupling factor (superfamily II helicase)